jgi:hypothetical protein
MRSSRRSINLMFTDWANRGLNLWSYEPRTQLLSYGVSEYAIAPDNDLVDVIEDRITVYRDTSELARLNAMAAHGWQPVEADLFALLLEARNLHERTGGAFDMAAGSLVRTWGFLRRQGRTPTAEELARAREARPYGLPGGSRSSVTVQRSGQVEKEKA